MKTKNNKKIIISICITISILLVIVIVLNTIINNKKRNEQLKEQVNSYTSIKDFKTIEEVAVYLECEYKKQEESKEKDYTTDVYMKLKIMPYTNEKSNEGFYKKLIAYSASVLKYRNFRIIDKDNDITVNVICDSENKKITSYLINGENNYFEKHDSYIEASKIEDTKETKLNIQSNLLTKLMENDWKINDSEIGTKESFFNKYDIYFDEGIEVRKVDGKVFNIVFNSKYKEKIANDITTSMTKDEIIKKLGEPIFEDEEQNIIGYRGKELYCFYSNKNHQISIYRIENNVNNKEIFEIYKRYKEENSDENSFINEIKDKFTDYDKYKETESYVELQYTLKGIKLQFGIDNKNGVVVYNNYLGDISENITIQQIKNDSNYNLPEGIFFENNNLVYLYESNRILENNSLVYMATMQRQSLGDTKTKSNLFIEYKETNQDGSYKIKFISLDKNNVNSELKENIDYGMWLNDRYYIYSIKNRGIYIYDVQSRNYGTLISGSGSNYELKEVKGNTLKYDDKTVIIKI